MSGLLDLALQAHGGLDRWRQIGTLDLRRVWIEDADGQSVDERTSPKASFAGHDLRTPWDQLQRLYFTGYAVWNCLAIPFLLANSRFVSREIEPHRENGYVWRRLQVTFPPEVPTHCAEQTLYFDREGRLQRLDYEIDIAGATVAHYCYDHAVVSGLVIPTLHRVVQRSSAGVQLSGPTGVLVQLQLSNFIAS